MLIKSDRTTARNTIAACFWAICAIVLFAPTNPGLAQTSDAAKAAQAPGAENGSSDLAWPRKFETASGSAMVLYQPQVTAWNNFTDLTAMIAAEYTTKGSDNPAAGVISVSAKTAVDKDAGTVAIYDIAVDKLNFSTLGRSELADASLEVGKILPTAPITMSLDGVTASLADYARLQDTTGLQTDAPPIFVENVPAILVQTNGAEVTAAVELTTGLSFVVNTNWDILKTDNPSAYYLRDDKSWLTAEKLTGPWQPVDALPKIFDSLPDNDNWKEAKAAIPPQPFSGPAPQVVYSDKPAELILIDGQPSLEDVPGTNLAWVSNTNSDLFYLKTDGSWYFLTSGRWFRATDLKGPWTFATPNLPADFQRIPANQPYSSVRASIPETSESDVARLQASIPQTARVERDKVTINVTYSGDPQFVRIDGTSLSYAVNTNFVVIRVGDQYFVCDGGIWFVGSSPTGPFAVADTVPSEIYNIPPSSPVYNVTYVRVYNSDPAAVWFGFTAGYLWGYLAWDTYVYGTGYYYPPYWYRRPLYPPIYYPRAVTYGGGIHYYSDGSWGRYGYAYGPYRGVEAGGWYNPETGRYVRGAAAWGPYGGRGYIAAGNVNTGRRVVAHGGTNPYASWGSVGVEKGSNWAVARGYSNKNGGGAVRWNSSSGNRGFAGHTANSDLYAGRDGNVYRKTDNGWEKYDNGNWSPINRPNGSQMKSLGANKTSQDRKLPTPSSRQTSTRPAELKPPSAQSPSGPFGRIQAGNGNLQQQLDRASSDRKLGNARMVERNQNRAGESCLPGARLGCPRSGSSGSGRLFQPGRRR